MDRRIVIGLGTLLVLVPLLMWLEERRAPLPPAPPPPVLLRRFSGIPPVRRAVVMKLEGLVERWRVGGARIPVAPGDELALDELIATGPGARATLGMGEVTVLVHGRSRLSVLELAQNVSRVRLDDGHISADVHGGAGRRFRVEVRGTTAAAEARRASFSMLRSGAGTVALATREGAVDLSARGRSVVVEAGAQSVVLPGMPPSPPERIPTSLLLRVERPRVLGTREEPLVLSVRGATAPGAVVRIGQVHVSADARGGFSGEVPLPAARRRIRVEAEDASGRTTSRTVSVPQRLHRPRRERSLSVDSWVKW